MGRIAAPMALAAAALVIGCATAEPPPAPTPLPKASVERTEDAAFEAERLLNSAERSLEGLQPDEAEQQLEAADKALAAPEVQSYPEASTLRARYRELLSRVPATREEIARRELAAKVKQAKEKLDAATAELKSAVVEIKKRRPDEAELKRAGAALEALAELIEAGDELERKDLPYAKIALAIRKELQGQKTFVEQRRLQVAVDAAREDLAKAGTQLVNALKALRNKEVTEPDFEVAAAAVREVEAAIGRAEPTSGKEIGLAKHLAAIRERLVAQKKSIEERRHQVTVAAQRQQVERAKATLRAALEALKAKVVSPAAFTEAEGAVAALAKVLDDGAKLASEDRGYAGVNAEARKLVEASGARIAARKLDLEVAEAVARLDVALARLAETTKRMSTAEDFQAAEAALGEVEKILETQDALGAKSVAYSRRATGGRKAVAQSKKQIQDRKDAVAVDTQKAKLTVSRESIRDALKALEGFSPAEEQFSGAVKAIDQAEKALEEGAELERRSPGYAAYALGVRKALAASRQRIEQRKLAVNARERRMLVEDGLATAKSRTASAKRPAAPLDDVKAAQEAIRAAREVISDGAALEKRDPVYGRFAASVRLQLGALQQAADQAAELAAFRDGPVAQLVASQAAIDSARAIPPPDQHKALQEAKDKLKTCQQEAASQLAEHPRLAGMPFAVGKKKQKGAAVLAACSATAKTVESKLGALEAAVAFYEGPAKSMGKARALLVEAEMASEEAARQKTYGEAAAQFEECVGSGKILQHKHPQLNKERFDIDGRKVTLPRLIDACQKGAQTARLSMGTKS